MDNILDYLAALAGIGGLIVAAVTAYNAANKAAVQSLEKLVKTLQEELKDEIAKRKSLERQLATTTAHAARVERWARALVQQLKDHKLDPVDFDEID